jgi:MFS family permease
LQIIFYGLSLNFIGGVVLVLMFLLQWEHMLALMIPVFIITIGNGLLMPLSSANAISLYPNNSGMVTGMLGSLQLSAAGFGTALIGFIEGATLLPLGIIVIVISVFTICYFLKVYKAKKSSDIIMG